MSATAHKPICRNIKEGNVCRFGSECRYSHALETLGNTDIFLYNILSKDPSELTASDEEDIKLGFLFVRDTCNSLNDEEATYARDIFSAFGMDEWYPTEVDMVDTADLFGDAIQFTDEVTAIFEDKDFAAHAAEFDEEITDDITGAEEHAHFQAMKEAAAAFAAATECDFC